MKNFDAIILGSGQGGNPLALKLSAAGWKTALVEKKLIGGTCINYGCTPSKTMISSARNAWLIQHADEFGIRVNKAEADLGKIRKRKEKVVKQFRDSIEKGLKKAKNLRLYEGEASFGAPDTVLIRHKGKTEKIRGNKIFINTGTRPFIPSIKGLETVPFLDTASVMELTAIPEHLCIIGAGYNGLELGQMFRRFGSRVSVLEKDDRLLSKEDEDVAKEVQEILEGEGIRFYLETEVEEVRETKKKMIRLSLKGQGEKTSLNCSHLLLAAGRTPNSDRLDLGAAGVHTGEKGYIEVNSRLETNVKGIYALGDVKGGPAFTHISYNDHLVICKNLLENKRASILNRPLPYCMFTDPQLGRIGLTEKQAGETGSQILVARLPMERVARAIETGETRGFMKAIVDAKTRKILGAAIIGTEGGEVMTVLQMAMMGNIPYDKIRDGVFAHPTFSESLNNLFMTL